MFWATITRQYIITYALQDFDFQSFSSLSCWSAHHSLIAMADPEILKGWGAKDNVSASSSFIANAHNELYAFYTGKGGLLKTIVI